MKGYKLNNLINDLLSPLNERQKDILRSRFGLINGRVLTLAAIGNKYNITRERVRQIENLALASLKPRFQREAGQNVLALIGDSLKKAGGAQRTDILAAALRRHLESRGGCYDRQLNFVLASSGKFKYFAENNDFYSFWYLNDAIIDKLIKFTEAAAEALTMGRKLPRCAFTDNYFSLSKKFAVSPYNDFGLACWPHIKPRVSRDWAYLVLKKEGRPLHFVELTKIINGLRPKKAANPQTVHNELIKDNRFVLVGRGTYGLKEFNILPGTAREVIVQVLKKYGPQTSRNVIKLVLEERMFKENTLLLNLQNRNYFKRLADGRYTVKEV